MSLIVGYAAEDIGFLVADTLLSFPIERYDPRNPVIEKFHALKIQILTSDVAVAFAGEVQTSLAVIGRLHQELTADPELCVPQRLLELRQELAADASGAFQGDCEFLVLVITSKQTKRLARVNKDRVSYVQRAYIGDGTEYSHFRALVRHYDGPVIRRIQNADGTFGDASQAVTDGEKEFDQVSDAMEKLTHQRRSGTVGAICGCVTRVVDARISGKLEYLQSVEASVSPAEGLGGFSLLASNFGPHRGVGLYYRGWRAGLLFIVSDLVPCRKETAATIEEFVEVANSKYGLNLEGGMW